MAIMLLGAILLAADPVQAAPRIIDVAPPVVMAGASLLLNGTGFTPGSVVNFFVANASGAVNEGPLAPSAVTASQLTVAVPASISLGEGVVALQVVNTDQGFAASNTTLALLQGSATAGIPSITGVDGIALAADSVDPGVAIANVETVIAAGHIVTIDGIGFDTDNGVAVDLFCACPGGKVGPFLIAKGDSGLTSSAIGFLLPAAGMFVPATGPGSIRVSNAGADGAYSKSSNAVSVQVGARPSLDKVAQSGCTINATGAGFSERTVLNLFQNQGGTTVNLGGYAADGALMIPFKLAADTLVSFDVPAAAIDGPAYLQALNPPFTSFASSGTGPGGIVMITKCTPALSTHYVSPIGDDASDGRTRSTAWRTIGHAADTMTAGDSVTVTAGNYAERVTMTASGMPSKPIVYSAEGSALANGFEITGSYVTVQGFQVQAPGDFDEGNIRHAYGSYVGGTGDRFMGNFIHDTCAEGIAVSGQDNVVSGNVVLRAGMAAISVDGIGNQVVGNDVSQTLQYPPGCRQRDGADADAFRFFGSGHLFRDNYAHDIDWGTAANPGPHVDCFQSWGPASNILIDHNQCIWGAPAANIDREISSLESLAGATNGITFRNNAFVNMRDGILAEVGTSAIKVVNNIACNVLDNLAEFHDSPNGQVSDNSLFAVGAPYLLDGDIAGFLASGNVIALACPDLSSFQAQRSSGRHWLTASGRRAGIEAERRQ